ncbi:IucC family-domain-containing protein [Crassisporium funariophilum]|nr:IucC family-domain-containing protein [Crassisporium funariophilum]
MPASTLDLGSKPYEKAQFATTARLLSCLVTESLVHAIYHPLRGSEAAGFALILKGEVLPSKSLFDVDDILVILPLHHPPVLQGAAIGLLDPLDMMSLAFETGSGQQSITDARTSEHTLLISDILNVLADIGCVPITKGLIYRSTDALSIWSKFASSYKLDTLLREDIGRELSSAIKWQTYSYQHPRPAPLFSSSSIEWEQSIIEGHPTHPMHKTRRFLPPLQEYSPDTYDLLHPQLRFISVPQDRMKVTYNFMELTLPVLRAASLRAGKELIVKNDHIVVPVHELQIIHIRDKFPEAFVYPEEFSLPLLAQQSLRSVVVPDAYDILQLKLGVGVKLTSAVRTISPESAYLGPRFSAQVVPALTMDHTVVTVAKELASVVHVNPNGEIAKHCAAIVREYHEGRSDGLNERHIVCTSLVESGHSGPQGHLPSVVRIFNLDTEEKRLSWLDKFIAIFLRAFLPPMLHNGVAFECHPQNCVARFDVNTQELKGFIIRDFGGLRVHLETLKATTGVDLDFLDGHSIIAAELEDVYTRMYHTIIHNHFQQLIRILGLHYNGLGWEIVRQQLRENIPLEHPLYNAWLSPERRTLPGKCFLRMRMAGHYRFHLHGPFPNLIHYRGSETQLVD